MQLDQNDTYAKVVSIIADQLNISKDSIVSESNLETLGADSLDRVEIVMKLEEEFNIEINDDDAESIKTVGDAVNYVHNLRSQK